MPSPTSFASGRVDGKHDRGRALALEVLVEMEDLLARRRQAPQGAEDRLLPAEVPEVRGEAKSDRRAEPAPELDEPRQLRTAARRAGSPTLELARDERRVPLARGGRRDPRVAPAGQARDPTQVVVLVLQREHELAQRGRPLRVAGADVRRPRARVVHAAVALEREQGPAQDTRAARGETEGPVHLLVVGLRRARVAAVEEPHAALPKRGGALDHDPHLLAGLQARQLDGDAQERLRLLLVEGGRRRRRDQRGGEQRDWKSRAHESLYRRIQRRP